MPECEHNRIKKNSTIDDLAVNAPDSIGGLHNLTSRWWGKYRNRILLNCFFITMIAIGFFYSHGRDKPELFITGVITGMVLSIITWTTEWRQLNMAGAGKYKHMSLTRRKKITNYLIIVGLIIVVMFLIGFILVKTGIRISEFYAFFSGLILFAWTQYVEVIYWERKNRKTLIVDKTSFYAVDIDSG